MHATFIVVSLVLMHLVAFCLVMFYIIVTAVRQVSVFQIPNERYRQLCDLLYNTEKVKHIRNQFYVSNKSSKDESFDKLRS